MNLLWGRVGDVTGDGREDALQLTLSGNLQVLDSTTNTPIPWLTRPGAGAFGLTYTPVGDYDGDGKDDLAYWGTNSLSTVTPIVISGADGTTLLTLNGATRITGGGDFDGDGRSDVFVTFGATSRILSSRTGGALLEFVATPPPLTIGSMLFEYIAPVGDEDGDGLDDVVFDSRQFPNFATRTFLRATGVSFPSLGGQPVGDVTGDGRSDLYVYPGTIVAGGTHATAWTNLPGPQPLGDVNGDGFHDLTTLTIDASGVTTVFVHSGASHAILTSLVSWFELPKPVGDLDGDGRMECSLNGILYQWVDPAVAVASRMLRRGTPGTTSDGRRPYLVTRGHCGLGRTAFFDMRGCMPNGLALLVYGSNVDVDLTGLGAPNNRSYTSLAGGFAFVANGNGIAQYQATVPLTPSLLGTSLSLQTVVVDAAANALGLVTSNAVDITTNN